MRKLLLDLPSTQPALGFGDTADALARVIDQSDPQFAVGIFGGWGSGKTTLMQAIEHRLDAERTVPVRFSAWRYEREEHLIVPLLDTLREALLAWSTTHPHQADQARQTASTIGRIMRSILAGMSIKVGVPGAIDLSFDANKALTQHRDDAKADEDANVPRSFYHASFRALQDAFGAFVGHETADQRRIVVFVDDLDRCLPENALQVLESMKLFFDLPGFVFVVGLDQDVVEYVIDTKYAPKETSGDDQAGSRVSGAQYIKKIFQLPYRLAPVALHQLDEFLHAAYAEAGVSDEQRAELSDRVTPHLRWVVGDASVNPREIKRYINAFTLLVEVDASERLDRRAVLALQTVAFRSDRDWGPVQDALLQYEDLFVDALRRHTGGNPNALGDLDPELQSIPDDFLEYVTGHAPGRPLLEVGPLGPYISSGEAVRSTQNPALLAAVRDAGSVRRLLRQVPAGERTMTEVAPDVLKALSNVEGTLSQSGRPGSPPDAVLADVLEMRQAVERFGGAGDENLDSTVITERLEPLARNIVRRVLRKYRYGDVAR